MRVVDHEPAEWFLLETGDSLFLDVNCSHGPAGYSILVALDVEEAAAFRQEGRTFVGRLARSVQDAGPGSALQGRDRTLDYRDEVRAAIAEWRMSSGQTQNLDLESFGSD